MHERDSLPLQEVEYQGRRGQNGKEDKTSSSIEHLQLNSCVMPSSQRRCRTKYNLVSQCVCAMQMFLRPREG